MECVYIVLFFFFTVNSSSLTQFLFFFSFFTGLPGKPSQKFDFRSSVATVWYRETMFSQMVSYRIFSCTNPCTDSFCTSSPLPLKKNTRRCEPEEGYLRCSKRFDHGSHSIIFLLFAFKSIHVPRATRLNL